MSAKTTRGELLRHLRDGLNRLQDPNYLRRSPLATLFGVANRYDTPSAVRRILTEAIERLEPPADEPSDSRAWRMYESMYYRYVEQFQQEDVARQLGMSVRQVQREQQAALEALTYQLWERFTAEAQPQEKGEIEAAAQADATQAALDEEVPWLRGTPPEAPADLTEVLANVLSLAQPLAGKHGVHLRVAFEGTPPAVAMDPVALRQMLLNLLGVVIPRASRCGEAGICVRVLAWEVEIRILCQGPITAPGGTTDDERGTLDVVRRLAEMCSGRLAVSLDGESLAATLTLPALERLPVLVIDDNEGTLRLLQRYTAGTRYRLVGVRDPEEALAVAEKLSPQLIVLDVMMPRVDGWQVLGRLREHPAIEGIPIIVCSILAQEELALSLGAAGLVRKPVSRHDFLAALDGLVGNCGN